VRISGTSTKIDEERHGTSQPERRELGDVDRDAEREWRRDDEGDDRGDDGAVDGRRRTESPIDGIPIARRQEPEPELP
jgi:hypothetical protein